MGWIENVFSDPEDEYDVVWHNKLAFSEVGNGDYLAFDMSNTEDAPIVYLSHDNGEGHGYILANNFIEFLNNPPTISPEIEAAFKRQWEEKSLENKER